MKKLPKTITQEEFEKIFKATKKSYRKDKRQILLAMLLGFEAGMRISEIVGHHKQVSRCCKADTKIVRDKEKKRKFKYCIKCEKLLGLKDTVFCSEWKIYPLTRDKVDQTSIRIECGKGEKDRIVSRPKRVNVNVIKLLPLKIGRRTLQRYTSQLGREVLGKEITFHTLRHGFATHYYNKTGDILGLQRSLGHTRPDTTAIYSHTNPIKTNEKIREAFD